VAVVAGPRGPGLGGDCCRVLRDPRRHEHAASCIDDGTGPVHSSHESDHAYRPRPVAIRASDSAAIGWSSGAGCPGAVAAGRPRRSHAERVFEEARERCSCPDARGAAKSSERRHSYVEGLERTRVSRGSRHRRPISPGCAEDASRTVVQVSGLSRPERRARRSGCCATPKGRCQGSVWDWDSPECLGRQPVHPNRQSWCSRHDHNDQGRIGRFSDASKPTQPKSSRTSAGPRRREPEGRAANCPPNWPRH
jgi:hypothetical protein